VTNTKFCFK